MFRPQLSFTVDIAGHSGSSRCDELAVDRSAVGNSFNIGDPTSPNFNARDTAIKLHHLIVAGCRRDRFGTGMLGPCLSSIEIVVVIVAGTLVCLKGHWKSLRLCIQMICLYLLDDFVATEHDDGEADTDAGRYKELWAGEKRKDTGSTGLDASQHARTEATSDAANLSERESNGGERVGVLFEVLDCGGGRRLGALGLDEYAMGLADELAHVGLGGSGGCVVTQAGFVEVAVRKIHVDWLFVGG